MRSGFTDTAERNRNGDELDRIVLESISERGKWDLFTEAATSADVVRAGADSV